MATHSRSTARCSRGGTGADIHLFPPPRTPVSTQYIRIAQSTKIPITRAQQEAARRAKDRPEIRIDEDSDADLSPSEEENTLEEEDPCRPLDDSIRRKIQSQRGPSPTSSPFSTINLSDLEPSQPPSRERSDSEATAVPPPPPSTSLWQSQNSHALGTNLLSQSPTSYPTPPNLRSQALQLTGLTQPRHASPTTQAPTKQLPQTTTPQSPTKPPSPGMAGANDQNLHWARERLRDLDRFDGKELTAKQVESTWRKRFSRMVNAYKVNDEQQRNLWLEHLEEPSLASEWAERMETEGKIDTWDALVKELGLRWPAPDEVEKQKERTERWYQHVINKEKLGTKTEGIGGGAEPYYVVWAREHMALAAEMGAGKTGEEKFMVEWTWHRALPSTIKGLLPKELSKYKTIAELCKDVIGIEYDQVLVLTRAEKAQKETENLVGQLNKRIASLEIQSRATTHMADPSQTTAQPKAPAATPKGAITQSNAPAKSTKGRGQTFGKNPTGYDLYQAAVSNLPTDWLSMQNYPLTPGTFSQSASICTRCGKGSHASEVCYRRALPEKEIEWRKRAREELGSIKPGPTKAEIFQVLVEKFGKEVAEILPNNAHMPPTLPFQQWTYLTADKNHAVKTRGTIDAGSQANVLDAALWAANESNLGPLKPSQTLLRVADGKASQCLGQWSGQVKLAGQTLRSNFEVFDSGGAFEVLLGKPWLTQVKATQSFVDDTLHLPGLKPIPNAYPLTEKRTEEPEESEEPKGELKTEPREELKVEPKVEEAKVELKEEEPKEEPKEEPRQEQTRRRSRRLAAKGSRYWVPETQVALLEAEVGMRGTGPGEGGQETPQARLDKAVARAKQALARQKRAEALALEEELEILNINKVHDAHLPVNQSQRQTNPFAAERVAKIQNRVVVGDNLSESQKASIRALVASYADVFALDLSEVRAVKTHSHKLNIPPETKFRTRVGQKPLSQAQRTWLYSTLDEMEAANIIKQVPNTFPVAVSPTNVVPKPGGAEEPSLEYIQMLANRACKEVGIPVRYPSPTPPPTAPTRKEEKFRLVHNFAEVNEVTQIPAFPMGDLAAKQRNVAGYKRVCTIDFASGFNALPMEESSIKYTGFYVEGRGHYVYLCMPFGLTGAPTAFCEMLADALYDLLGDGAEVWMDNICLAFNDFDKGLSKLGRLLDRCRVRGLSIAPAKTHLFMEEAVFAGAKVSERGIEPDRRKVQAILEWPEPTSVLEVMGFLGITGAFRAKIKDYARIAQPLSDLVRTVKVKKRADGRSVKGEYKRALENAKVELTDEAKKAFIELKLILTTNPVLRAPEYDGRSFRITTDGSKYGFGAMLLQEWDEEDTRSGTTKKISYPIAFASKRTSQTEEKYAPFLLEFAALKFAFDSFAQIIAAQDIEVETDCKALADLLGNKKISSTHERWRNTIVAHRIVAVRHQPGAENPVCDGLSRMWQYQEDSEEGNGREETVDPDWEAHKGLLVEVQYVMEDTEAGETLRRGSGRRRFDTGKHREGTEASRAPSGWI
ncbi:hypothetical protein RHS04_00782 [Rhizoctonia solani]|uniref:RNA-directed DNA polymerase n=1 Tax=Rhizoctonia solani TaxID=456999 RepID=A0A8H7HFY9_9AGAM|nr:hypothetical protein RHS04_00782 [Rhizoctonia solani]